MPSGAKKRKAAKKKKGNQPNPSPASSHGGDDVKRNEVDVEGVSSPASQDHHKEAMEDNEKVSNPPSMVGEKSEGPAIPGDREFQIEGESDENSMSKKSYDGGSSSSSSSQSSSSSEDESHGIKNGQAVVNLVPIVDSVKTAGTLSEEHVEAIESTQSSCVVESVVEDNGVEKESCDEQLNVSYNAPIVTVDNGRDADKDSEVTEPLLVPARVQVQTTSWKSCCGLFELFSGSDR